MDIPAGMGHNAPPVTLDDILEGENAPSDADVLAALERRWRAATPEITVLAEKAAALAANKARLPKTLEGEQIENALGLIAAINSHGEAVDASSTLPAALKQAAKTAEGLTKPLTKDLPGLDKAARTLVTDWLKRDLDARNAAALPGAEKAATNMRLGKSGARAAITLQDEIAITDPALIPAKYLVPDLGAITKAVEAGETIPGTAITQVPQLRITWPEKARRDKAA